MRKAKTGTEVVGKIAANATTKPDWRNPADYPAPEGTSPRRWAWEFLRRNPDYRADWEAFANRLRAAAGTRPALALAVRHELNGEIADENSRLMLTAWFVEHEQLEEGIDNGRPVRAPFDRWLARKWGLRQLENPEGIQPPQWETTTSAISLPGPYADHLTPEGRDRTGKVALTFDVSLPMAPQIESAANYLRIVADRWQQANPQPPRGRANKTDATSFVEMLRILDADAECTADPDIIAALWPGQDNGYPDYPLRKRLATRRRTAHEYRDGKYRELLLSLVYGTRRIKAPV